MPSDARIEGVRVFLVDEKTEGGARGVVLVHFILECVCLVD